MYHSNCYNYVYNDYDCVCSDDAPMILKERLREMSSSWSSSSSDPSPSSSSSDSQDSSTQQRNSNSRLAYFKQKSDWLILRYYGIFFLKTGKLWKFSVFSHPRKSPQTQKQISTIFASSPGGLLPFWKILKKWLFMEVCTFLL